MNHKQAKSRRSELYELDPHDPNPHCAGALTHMRNATWGGIAWSLCYCPACDVYLALADGAAHPDNYALSPVTRSRMFGEADAARLGVIHVRERVRATHPLTGAPGQAVRYRQIGDVVDYDGVHLFVDFGRGAVAVRPSSVQTVRYPKLVGPARKS